MLTMDQFDISISSALWYYNCEAALLEIEYESHLSIDCPEVETSVKSRRITVIKTGEILKDDQIDFSLWENECEIREDPEFVCLSDDGWETTIKWYINFVYEDSDKNTPPTIQKYDLNNNLLSGYDVVDCQDSVVSIESDKIAMCDDDGIFYRWILKENGEPTGDFFDTTLSGQPYTPVGKVLDFEETNPLLPYEWTCGGAPSTYITYKTECPMESFIPATSPDNLYVHAILDTQTEQKFDVITWAPYNYTTGGVLATDAASIQLAVDAAMINKGFAAWDAIYGYNLETNEVFISLAPYADISVTWSTLELRAWWSATPDTYTNKCVFWAETTSDAGSEKYIKVKTVCWEESNTPWVFNVAPNNSHTMTAGTYASISLTAIWWTADISIWSDTVTIPEKFTMARDATTILDKEITITTSATANVLINYTQ